MYKEFGGSSPEAQGIDSKVLCDALISIVNKEVMIDSLTVVRNGHLLLDAYFYPFTKSRKHRIQSCTKSILSLLVGIAIDHGFINSVDQRMVDFFPEYKDGCELKKEITVRHLLTMMHGLSINEKSERETQQMQHSDDWVAYIFNKDMRNPPDTVFQYNDLGSHLLSAIIQRQTGMKTADFADKYLFSKLGIDEVFWRSDPQGVTLGYCDLEMLPLDLAKIGCIILDRGMWHERRIVSESWVRESTRISVEKTPEFDKHGYHWWIDTKGRLLSWGQFGQFLIIDSTSNTVITVTGDLDPYRQSLPRRIVGNILKNASPKPLLQNPVAELRLSRLVEEISEPPEKGWIWHSEPEGVAINGVFLRRRKPAFQFEYMENCKKISVDQSVYMKMKVGGVAALLQVGSVAGYEDCSLESVGPLLCDRMVNNDQRAEINNGAIEKHYEIELHNGIQAYITEYRWRYLSILENVDVLITFYIGDSLVYFQIQSSNTAPELLDCVLNSLTVSV